MLNCQSLSTDLLLSDIPKAIEVLRNYQKFPPLAMTQIKMIECMVMGWNSAHQIPTGSGKTYPSICLPDILTILRDEFGHKSIPSETRVLVIVPLINIFHSLSTQMKILKISHQLIEAGSSTEIDRNVKVVVISPEKLLDQMVMKSILKLQWSAIAVDEANC